MALPKVNLDDKTYTEIVREAVARIPSYAPEWTNHNASDPGITLVELFAWLVESQMYRVNKITDTARLNFLKLLGVNLAVDEAMDEAMVRARIDDAVITIQKDFRSVTRAVTSTDYESIVENAVKSPDITELVKPCKSISRVKAIPGYHPRQPRPVPGVVTILLVPGKPPVPQSVFASIYKCLDHEFRMLTVEVFIIEAQYVNVTITGKIAVKSTSVFDEVQTRVVSRLREFIDPLTGGNNGDGWPFGRGIYLSEMLKVIDDVDGIDFAEIAAGGIRADCNGVPIVPDAQGNLAIPRHALVRYFMSTITDYNKTTGV